VQAAPPSAAPSWKTHIFENGAAREDDIVHIADVFVKGMQSAADLCWSQKEARRSIFIAPVAQLFVVLGGIFLLKSIDSPHRNPLSYECSEYISAV